MRFFYWVIGLCVCAVTSCTGEAARDEDCGSAGTQHGGAGGAGAVSRGGDSAGRGGSQTCECKGSSTWTCFETRMNGLPGDSRFAVIETLSCSGCIAYMRECQFGCGSWRTLCQ
jgi:hypothetical protein